MHDPRTITIFTGMKGAKIIQEALEYDATLSIYKAQLNFLKKNKRITNEQKTNLMNMLKSPDLDNRDLACMIIDKFDDNEYSI